jgi:hypothetical protein
MKISGTFARLSVVRSGEIELPVGEVETDKLVDPACAWLSE